MWFRKRRHATGTPLTCARPHVYRTATHGFPELDVTAAGANGKPVRRTSVSVHEVGPDTVEITSPSLTKELIQSESVEDPGRSDHRAHSS